MAEKPNPRSQPRKAQASPQRRGQVALPRARLAQEVTAPARPARNPSTSHRTLPPALAASLASVRSRTLVTSQQPPVPSAQDTPGTSTATQSRAGDPEDSTELPQQRVRVARLTEDALRQLGGISKYQRILEWLDNTFGSRAEAMTELPAELEAELDGYWECHEHDNN